MDWQNNLIGSDIDVRELLAATRNIAVIGIKPESRSGEPAHYVPKYMKTAGYRIMPVPVYYPEINEILGEPVHRDLSSIQEKIEMVNVFRRSEHLHLHLDEILNAAPSSVWIQLGIRDDAFAEKLARAGIKVVQDKCLLVEHRALIG